MKTVHIAAIWFFATIKLACAANLTPQDTRYLEEFTGLPKNHRIISDMLPFEQQELHDLINEPGMQEYSMRDTLVLLYLGKLYSRECERWVRVHIRPPCPPTATPETQRGKEVADRACNNCHLFGTSDAISFFKLARRGMPSTDEFKNILKVGHRMSPITLTDDEIDDLLRYIISLK